MSSRIGATMQRAAGAVKRRLSARAGLAFRQTRNYFRKEIGEPPMTTGPNRIFDDFAKLMTDAAGAAQGVRREVETAFRSQAERILNSMDIVKREEFEAMRDMAIKARAENEILSARLDALEAKLAASSPSSEPANPIGTDPTMG
jgi:BMFP domain-containing protein YqiC